MKNLGLLAAAMTLAAAPVNAERMCVTDPNWTLYEQVPHPTKVWRTSQGEQPFMHSVPRPKPCVAEALDDAMDMAFTVNIPNQLAQRGMDYSNIRIVHGDSDLRFVYAISESSSPSVHVIGAVPNIYRDSTLVLPDIVSVHPIPSSSQGIKDLFRYIPEENISVYSPIGSLNFLRD